MRIRTQLIVAFLLLAVLPLSGIVLFSYFNSKAALEETAQAAADVRNQEMQHRMAGLRHTLTRQTEMLGGQLLRYLGSEAEASESPKSADDWARMVGALGEEAEMIEGIVFMPEKPPAPPGAPAPKLLPEDIPGKGTFIAMRGENLELDIPEMIRAARVEALRELAETEDTPALARTGIDLGLRWLANVIESQALEEDSNPEAEVDDGAPVLRHAEGRTLRPPQPPAPPVSGSAPPAAPVRETSMTWASMEKELKQNGRIVGRIRPRVNARVMVRHVLRHTDRDQGEIPFAVDREGHLFVLDEDEALLDDLRLAERLREEGVLDEPGTTEVLALSGPAKSADSAEPDYSFRIGDEWVVVTTNDPASDLILGIASPFGDSLETLRATTFRNLMVGLIFIVFAVFGILPISRRMTRHLDQVTAGAERIASGDLSVRLPETGTDEFGQLARVFNRMTTDLDQQQRKLLDQQRQRRAQMIEQSLLEAELQRKSEELEEARRFQLSMLPKALPESEDFDIAVEMRTATEVGGDYYDFAMTDEGLIVAIGDATGHGATAGRMVTVIKSLFSSWAGRGALAPFLADVQRAVKRMALGRMAMALALARLERHRLVLTSAGMPPLLIVRHRTGKIEEVTVPGMPLGGLDDSFTERQVDLESGDLVVLMSDGLPELANAAGEPLGYEAVRHHLERCATSRQCAPQDVINNFWEIVEERTGGEPPEDDVTFIVLRVR